VVGRTTAGKDRLPADFEPRSNKMIDDYLKKFPWDGIVQAWCRCTRNISGKGDVDHLVAFYSSPAGQKFLREMPAITREALPVMMPLMRQSMDRMTRDVRQRIAEMSKPPEAKPGPNPPTPKN
jgi:hypothetical protein